MKKTLSLVIAMMMIISLVSAISFGASAEGEGVAFTGTGTAEDPYVIESADNLIYLQKQVADGNDYAGKLFAQKNDIDLGNKDWTPIGDSGKKFAGVYDGANHKITGFAVTSPKGYVGLFGYIKSNGAEAGIMNLTIEGKIELATLEADSNIGAFAGYIEGTAQAGVKEYAAKGYNLVSNVNITVNDGGNKKQPRIGGIFGQATACELENITNNGTISSENNHVSRTGGVIGQTCRSNIRAAVNNGDVTSVVKTANDVQTAGIASVLTYYGGDGTLFERCVNNGKITGISEGGQVKIGSVFAGVWDGTNPKENTVKTTVSKCANNGAIYAECKDPAKNDLTGGICSYITNGGVTIEDTVNATNDIVTKGAFGNKENAKIGGLVFNLNVSGQPEVNLVKNSMTVTPNYYVGKGFTEENVKVSATAEEAKAAVDAIVALIKPVDAARIAGLSAPASFYATAQEPTPVTPPPTGDSVIIYATLAVLSLGAASALILRRKEN